MDRVVRIIGIAIVVALPVLAFRAFDGALSSTADGDPGSIIATADAAATRHDAAPAAPRETGAVQPRDADGQPPRYLAFGPAEEAMEARVYRVGDDPDVRDRDVEPDIDRSSSYPPETELVPDFSQAPVDEIEPGLYATSFQATDCSYELRRVDRSGQERLIGQERLGQGRLLVSINPIEPDIFQSAPQCSSWSPWSPLVEPLVQAGVGDYWIGDLARGVWSVPEGCLWEKVVAFRGARLADVTESDRGPAPLVVDDETTGVRIRDCERPLLLVEAEPPPWPGLEPGLEP